MNRLAALEAEVKADDEAQQARKAAALERLREQRVTQAAERDALRARQAELTTRASRKEPKTEARRERGSRDDESGAEPLEGLGGALELATKANRVKQELSRKTQKGEKSWIVSGVASLALGPIGWLYAGSWREAMPAGVAWLALGAVVFNILPAFLMMPVLMVMLPLSALSAVAGVVYAMQYNRSGSRQRLFDRDDKTKPKKQLPGR